MEKIISYNGKLIVQELDKDFGESICHDILCDQGKSLLILLTTKGHLKLNIGHQDYLLEKQVLFTLFPIHPLEIIEVSSNYKGIAIKISREFLVNHSGDKGFYTINNMLRRQEDPCIFITIEEKYIILKKIAEIKNRIKDNEHIFYSTVIGNTLEGFMLDVNNLIMQKQKELSKTFFSRKSEIVNNFFELLYRFCEKEHSVVFYAKKFCISPQYLSLITKSQTGNTANQWIDDALSNEAIHLLRNPNISIQEIAYTLNFSDQSSFGKFFKKQKRMSPSKYRRTIISGISEDLKCSIARLNNF